MTNPEHPPKIRTFLSSRVTIVTLLLVVVTIIATLYSVLLFGKTSTNVPTGSITGVKTLITEDVRLQGVQISHVTLQTALSSVDDHWAQFVLTPKPAYSKDLETTYGFVAFRDRRWQLVADGTTNVGCATASKPALVPADVLRGFGRTCLASSQ